MWNIYKYTILRLVSISRMKRKLNRLKKIDTRRRNGWKTYTSTDYVTPAVSRLIKSTEQQRTFRQTSRQTNRHGQTDKTRDTFADNLNAGASGIVFIWEAAGFRHSQIEFNYQSVAGQRSSSAQNSWNQRRSAEVSRVLWRHGSADDRSGRSQTTWGFHKKQSGKSFHWANVQNGHRAALHCIHWTRTNERRSTPVPPPTRKAIACCIGT